MVETSLFPRPNFTSFLESDDNVDPLSYYQYQRLQRLQKVARLQERRAKSYEPGYKKPLLLLPSSTVCAEKQATSTTSRQIFTKPNLRLSHSSDQQSKHVTISPLKRENSSIVRQPQVAFVSDEVKKHQEEDRFPVPMIPGSQQVQMEKRNKEVREPRKELDQKHDQLPRAVGRKHSRSVKSATVQSMSASSKPHLLPRPKTAAVGTRDIGTITGAVSFQGSERKSEERKDDGSLVEIVDLNGDDGLASHIHKIESSSQVEKSKEEMAQTYQWTTSTQRAYNEVDWAERVPPPVLPPASTVEQFPDPVSQRLTFRRYNSCPEPWQVYGPEWDYVQTRFGDYQSQEPVNFCAPTRYNQYIPGYMGCVVPSNSGEVNHQFLSRLLVRRLTPRPTRTTKSANIPGYTGHTHWTRMEPVHSNMAHPNPLSTARVHREIPLEEDLSPFRRTSVMSKTVTLVSPYNPFNKIEY